jgi:hypothetical protein
VNRAVKQKDEKVSTGMTEYLTGLRADSGRNSKRVS